MGKYVSKRITGQFWCSPCKCICFLRGYEKTISGHFIGKTSISNHKRVLWNFELVNWYLSSRKTRTRSNQNLKNFILNSINHCIFNCLHEKNNRALSSNILIYFPFNFKKIFDRKEVENEWRKECDPLSPLDDTKIRYVMRKTNQTGIQTNIASKFGMSHRYALDFKPKYLILQESHFSLKANQNFISETFIKTECVKADVVYAEKENIILRSWILIIVSQDKELVKPWVTQQKQKSLVFHKTYLHPPESIFIQTISMRYLFGLRKIQISWCEGRIVGSKNFHHSKKLEKVESLERINWKV